MAFTGQADHETELAFDELEVIIPLDPRNTCSDEANSCFNDSPGLH